MRLFFTVFEKNVKIICWLIGFYVIYATTSLIHYYIHTITKINMFMKKIFLLLLSAITMMAVSDIPCKP